MSFFLVSSVLALTFFGAAGLIRSTTLWYVLLAAPAAYLGDKLGTALFLRFGDQIYRRVALLGLAAVGATITLRALL